jgi:hypothetical protein
MCLHTTECSENVASIRRVPKAVLPNGPARNVLSGMARDGYDCYIYQPAQRPDTPKRERRWNLWLNNQRYDLREWLSEFDQSSTTK